MNNSAIIAVLDNIENTNPEDIYERFEDAWAAIMGTELPVTTVLHTPPTDEQRFRALIALDAWETAAEMLTWPFYKDRKTAYRWAMTNHGYDNGKYMHGAGGYVYHPLSSGGAPKVQGFHPMPGVALLIAVLNAHLAWAGEDLAEFS